MTSLSTRLVFAWLLCAVIATLGPFDFGAAPPGQQHGFTVSRDGSDQQDPIHVGLNLLLFVPLGALLHHEGQRRSIKLLSIVIVTGAAAFLISLAVESLQRFLPNRESSLIDLVTNTTGGLMGVLGGRAWGSIHGSTDE